MTADAASLLIALQFADSAFPSGAFAFSWGLEGLVIDRHVDDASTLRAALDDALRHRWHRFDRVVLARVLAADGCLPALRAIDDEVDRLTWPAAARAGSRRAGRALLGVHRRLGHAGAAAYLQDLAGDADRGHQSVVQAIVWRELGLAPAALEAISAWSCANASCSAAIRLNLVGHVGAQQALCEARATIAELLARPVAADTPLRGFAPLIEIAMMRHAQREHRLFMT
ncbi:MAG: urease accessory UreF family protein [Burkholderiaceae bacterium]